MNRSEEKERDQVQRRATVLIAMILIILVGLLGQLGNMTLAQQGQYSVAAEAQRTRELPVFTGRGLIYDRKMEPLVVNQTIRAVYVRYPYYTRADLLHRLAKVLDLPLLELQRQVEQKTASQAYYEPVLVKEGLTPQQEALLLEQKTQLPGVEVQSLPARKYPHKDLASHVLGYVGQISQEELERKRTNGYLGGEKVGKTGLEAYYESELRGRHGLRRVEVNSYFEPLGVVQSTPPRPGNSLVLTLDADLQRVAERALDWNMWRIRNTIIGDGPWGNAKAGAVVVLEVKTGAILAMASRPAFDPNLFARGITEAEYQKLQDPILTPEINRAIHKAYQPGSTWKMLTSAAALSGGVVGTHEKIYCSGVYDKAGNPKDWTPLGHGWVDTVGALQGSCDIYYYEMGYRMGVDRLVEMARTFGFGQRTGVDLGAENPGLLPGVEERSDIWERQLNDPWGVGHTVSAAIGQIVQVTPLQLARYTATLGNQGRVMRPYLVQKIIDANGKVVREVAPQQTGQVKLAPEHLKAIIEGMLAVNTGPGGTSDYVIYPLPGMRAGGKTGTSENPPRDDYGFFVSMAPLHDPQIAVAVAIEQSGHGSSVSAVARAVEAAYFKVRLPPMDPANVPAEFPGDLAGLRRKYRVVGTGE